MAEIELVLLEHRQFVTSPTFHYNGLWSHFWLFQCTMKVINPSSHHKLMTIQSTQLHCYDRELLIISAVDWKTTLSTILHELSLPIDQIRKIFK